MGILQRFKNFWGITLGMIAIVSFAISIYTSFFQQKLPHLQYQILSETNVFDVHANVKGLQVIYHGKDLADSHELLTIDVIRVTNVGDNPLRISDFDVNGLPGMQISSGEIVDANISQPSTSYLRERAALVEATNSGVRLSPVIMSPSDSFLVNLLVRHSGSSPIQITAIGEVAGTGPIDVVHETEVKESFSDQVFAGGLLIQFARMISYFFVFVISLVIFIFTVVVPISSLSDKIAKSNRRARVESYERSKNVENNDRYSFIKDQFINHGASWISGFLWFADELRKNDGKVELSYKYLRDYDRQVFITYPPQLQILKAKLTEAKYLSKEGERYILDAAIVEEAIRFANAFDIPPSSHSMMIYSDPGE